MRLKNEDFGAPLALSKEREPEAREGSGARPAEGIMAARTSRASTSQSNLIAFRNKSVPTPFVSLPPVPRASEETEPQANSLVRVGRAHPSPIGSLEALAKRSLDLVVAATALFLLMPFMLVLGLAIRLDSRGPVLFRQIRTGRNGSQFEILKFRSMSVMENGDTIRQVTKDDERVTRIGRFIRSTSIDELPQLLNVLAGHMSIVGPRPHALAHDTLYAGKIPHYALRQHVRPGLTGWAQVNGCRGPTPRLEDMERRIALDLWYIQNRSFLLDIRIILRTVLVVMRKDDAF